jgi:hypothetical protein
LRRLGAEAVSATLALPLGEREIIQALRREAHPLTGDHRDYDALLALVADARVVLLGEASHGTHEFYRERARITKRLITEHGFTGVAIEGDWPDAYRVNRYVQGAAGDADAEAALGDFRRFPTWMWRNADVLGFVGWLRAHNERPHHAEPKVGFYGLDLYSLGASMESVIAYLDRQDPAAAARARERYECLQPYAGESASYGQAVLLGVGEPCRRRVIEQLVELRRRAGEYLLRDGPAAEDEYFFAEQNAAVVANAEEYYRTMFGDRAGSWNLRDRHMVDSPPPRNVALPPSANASAPPCATATRRFSTPPISRRSYSARSPPATAVGRCASHACTARSGSSTGRRPSARATGSPPASPGNTTRSSTSTSHAPSSHSSALPPGSSPSHPRRTRQRSEPLTHCRRRGDMVELLVDDARGRIAALGGVEPHAAYRQPAEELTMYSASLDLLVVDHAHGPRPQPAAACRAFHFSFGADSLRFRYIVRNPAVSAT